MELAHRWGARNLSKMEAFMGVIVIAMLFGTFTRYMFTAFSKAEQSMINSTVININTALHYRAAMVVMRGEYQELKLLKEMNPMEELQASPEINDLNMTLNHIPLALMGGTVATPVNYGGVTNSYTLESMEKGKWYFNQDNRYLINNSEFFLSSGEDFPMIRFRIVIDYEDRNADGQYDPENDEFQTMKLQPINHYQWKY